MNRMESPQKPIENRSKQEIIDEYLSQLDTLEQKIEQSPYSPGLIREIVEYKPSQETNRLLSQSGEQQALMPSTPLDQIKSGLLYTLSNRYQERLVKENASSDEGIALIKETENQIAELKNRGESHPDLLMVTNWSLHRLCGVKNENNNHAAIETASNIFSHSAIDKVRYTLVKNVFEKDKVHSSNKIIEHLAESQNAAGRFVLALADLLGAEEARKKIDEAILQNEGNDIAQNNLCNARSFITPCEDKLAIISLMEFYQENIKFEEYKVNKAMNAREVELLKTLISKEQKTLEMGCGAGRLIVALAKDGYDISGFDFTPRHVELTQEKLSEAGAKAEVFQNDWHNVEKVADESKDVVYSLGRNILHDYSIVDQVQSFRECNRILKKGGRFIFDIPNRKTGGYAQMVRGYADEMGKRGIRNFRYGTIYDSPDNTNFATRYAYSNEDIEELARLTGFKITDVQKKELETGAGDENLYYVLEKI